MCGSRTPQCQDVWEPRVTTESAKVFRSSRTAWLVSACLLAGVLVIGNSDLVMGKATPIWDANIFYGPFFSLVADHAKAGKLFLWNPWMDGGSPDFADPQVGATSPILLVFGLLSTNLLYGFVAYWMTIWIFGGIGMLLLCRHSGCPAWGGLIAALGFVASGFYTGHGEHTTILYSFSFLPWIIWRFDVALTRRSYWNMVVAGTLWGVSALGGYPALVILDPIFLAFWGLGRSCLGSSETDNAVSGGTRSRLIFAVAGLSLFGLVGVAVMSPSYLGFLLYTRGYTTRTGGITRDYAMVGPLPPPALATLASPFLYLLNLPPFLIWPETDISNSSVYTGALVVSLAAIAMFRRSKWRLWVGAIIVFFLACSVGNHLPIRGWLYDLIPPTRYFRFPALFSAYAITGLCILAAYGSRDVDMARHSGDLRIRLRFVMVSGAVAIAAILAFQCTLRSAHLQFSSVTHPSRVLLLIWLSIGIVFLLWWRRDISNRLLVLALVFISLYDASSAIKTGKPTLYSEASAPMWNVMVSNHVKSLDLTRNGLNRDWYPPADEFGRYQHDRNIVLKLPSFANVTGMVNWFFQPYVSDPALHQLAVGSQRIWFSDAPIWSPPSEEAFAEYVRASHTLGLPPLVLHTPEDMVKDPTSKALHSANMGETWAQAVQSASPAPVELLSYSPNVLSFRYNAPRDGWLLVTDRWAPFWKATVNNRHVQIAGANFIFRGIPVSRGENVVEFSYKPRGYLGLVILSWGVIGLVVVWDVVRRILSRRLTARQSL